LLDHPFLTGWVTHLSHTTKLRGIEVGDVSVETDSKNHLEELLGVTAERTAAGQRDAVSALQIL